MVVEIDIMWTKMSTHYSEDKDLQPEISVFFCFACFGLFWDDFGLGWSAAVLADWDLDFKNATRLGSEEEQNKISSNG